MYFPLFLPFRATYKGNFFFIATHNMFCNEQKKHVRTKKGILDDVFLVVNFVPLTQELLSPKSSLCIINSEVRKWIFGLLNIKKTTYK